MNRRNRFFFEADGLGGPAIADPAAALDPAAGDPAAPQAWQGPSQQEWEAQQQQLAYLSEYATRQMQAQQQQQQGQSPPWDPFDESFSERMARLEQQVQQFGQTHQAYTMNQGEELAYDIIADDVARNGEFLGGERSQQRAFQLAKAYMPDAVQRFGYGQQAAEAALAWACADVREDEETYGKAYHERQVNQLHTLAGAPREQGVGVTGQPITTGPYKPGERVTDRFLGRR